MVINREIPHQINNRSIGGRLFLIGMLVAWVAAFSMMPAITVANDSESGDDGGTPVIISLPQEDEQPPPDTEDEVDLDQPIEVDTEIEPPTDENVQDNDSQSSENNTEESSDASPVTDSIDDIPTPTELPATATPPVPFDPIVSCARSEQSTMPKAGNAELGWLDCTATWETENLTWLEVEATIREPGWDLIVVVPDSSGSSKLPTARSSQIEFDGASAGDAGFHSAHFLIGSRMSCLAAEQTEIALHLTASVDAADQESDPGATAIETSTQQIAESGIAATAPTLTIASAQFSDIVTDRESSQSSTGDIAMVFDGASPACGWSATVTFADFEAGGHTIPASDLSLLQASSDATTLDASMADGVLTLTSLPDPAIDSSSGAIQIELKLQPAGFAPQGQYGSTATITTWIPG